MNLRNLIIAHRGIHNKYVPENSVLAFKKCIEKKYPIELDVRLLKDNNIVVFHDTNLYRMTGLNKKIEKCTYEEIKDLKLLNTEEKIPLLKDILSIVGNRVLLMIELKNKKIGPLEKELLKILNDYSNFCIISFNIKSLNLIKKLNNKIKVGLITLGKKNKYVSLDNYDFVCHSIYGNNKKIKNNKPIFIWGININGIEKAKEYGDSFIVDIE